jgi:hypothetical protein
VDLHEEGVRQISSRDTSDYHSFSDMNPNPEKGVLFISACHSLIRHEIGRWNAAKYVLPFFDVKMSKIRGITPSFSGIIASRGPAYPIPGEGLRRRFMVSGVYVY